MKGSAAALFLLLCTMVLCFQDSLSLSEDRPTPCCFSYTFRKLPRRFVGDYFMTHSLCSKPAVVFVTTKGRHVCADPSHPWVQNYVDDLELNS